MPSLQYLLSEGALYSQTKVHLTRQTELAKLYVYSQNSSLAYPRTTQNANNAVGHLIPNDPLSWRNISSEIQYSLGAPRGQRSNVLVGPLRNQAGEQVLCTRRYATCQGIKTCPFIDADTSLFCHSEVTAELVDHQRKLLRRTAEISVEEDVYVHTLALWSTFRDHGCCGPVDETAYQIAQTPQKSRGAPAKPTCQGQLSLSKSGDHLFVRCQHYHPQNAKLHTNFPVSSTSYDVVYFQALFNKDTTMLETLEESMKDNGYGPLLPCTMVQNCTSVKVNCERHHRSSDGSMTMTELRRVPCNSSVVIYEPLLENRTACPNVLVVCSGPHDHPIPIPAHTPDSIVHSLIAFLCQLEDLPSLTSRRLLGNESAKFFLKTQLPHAVKPTFFDWHPSLVYPHGTGWDGVLHLKSVQDAQRPASERYIRCVKEMSLSRNPGNTEDVQVMGGVSDPAILRLIVCIKIQNSFRLVKEARHIQSDISFKRVSGWLEFELGGFDRVNMCAVVYVRAYLNRQTAEAHKIMLLEIDRIVYEDTGSRLQYRHLHASSKEDIDFPGILSWSVDQHRGQAKGIGEYLQAISPCQKFDLYEVFRPLTELGPYEHLERILRLCFAHYSRNIQKSTVSKEVKDAMYSLHGFIHKDGSEEAWKATLTFIENEGKKAGSDWLQDKIESKFAFPALCWQLTQHIPFKIWQASDDTTNVIKALHQDQLRDGKGLTLLGGILKGETYDTMRLQLLQNLTTVGIAPRYQPNTPSAQAYRSVTRQASSRKRQFANEDAKIHKQNNKFRKVHLELQEAREALQEATLKVRSGVWPPNRLEMAKSKVTKREAQCSKAQQDSVALSSKGTGSGNVKIQL